MEQWLPPHEADLSAEQISSIGLSLVVQLQHEHHAGIQIKLKQVLRVVSRIYLNIGVSDGMFEFYLG